MNHIARLQSELAESRELVRIARQNLVELEAYLLNFRAPAMITCTCARIFCPKSAKSALISLCERKSKPAKIRRLARALKLDSLERNT